MFEVLTKRDMIKRVAKAWAEQYPEGTARRTPENADILKRLEQLNPDTATVDDVADIIGNVGWTELKCHTCDTDNEKVVHLTDTEYYELFCEGCLSEMLALLKGKRTESETCWLCNGSMNDPVTIEVERETPNGKPCKPKEVKVHAGCYMDMEP